ncbi:hypothetical protein B0T16DRAFT_451264 [Cercophora newfieldiana]|uniref:Uncharacterized protein n=1 Tax=Cercophora newfieldiana TaxID=92897 RepID=A0AA39YPF8_9PEZI|nr:hypothetical protein B0T16DRAFT_451264 [Cercophora newfieldiana]
MCLKSQCDQCRRTTWTGCGNHVPKVMDNVPREEWCTCEPRVEKDGKEYPPKGSAAGVCIAS